MSRTAAGWRLARAIALSAVAMVASGDGFVNRKDGRQLVRANIGHAMPLGSLFDARTGQPVSGFLVEPSVIEGHTTVMETPFLNQKYVFSDDFSAKAHLMDIDGDMQLDMITGKAKLKVHAAAGYLRSKKSSQQTVRMSFGSVVHTETHMLDAFDPGVTTHMNRHVLDTGIATHVVTGIVFGQRNIATFESTFSNEAYKREVSAQFKLSLKSAGFSLKVRSSLHNLKETAGSGVDFSTYIFSDALPDVHPTTLEETMEYVKTAHVRLNGTKGVPVQYVLTPLALLDNTAAELVGSIQESLVEEARGVYDALEETSQGLDDLADQETKGNLAWLERVERQRKRFKRFYVWFIERLGQAVVDRRYGRVEESRISEVVEEYWKSNFSKDAMNLVLRDLHDEIANHRSLVGAVEAAGATVAESSADVTAPTLDVDNARVYLLVVADNGGRSGMGTVKTFADFALSNFRPDDATGEGRHCTYQRPDGEEREVCREQLQFVVVHFESFCETLCPAQFCFKYDRRRETVQGACPTLLEDDGDAVGNNKIPSAPGSVCRFNEEEAAQRNCWVRPEESTVASPPGWNTMFGGDWREWCACPTTHVREFDRKGAERRKELPTVPGRPAIVSVAGHDQQEPDAYMQFVWLSVEHPPGQATVLRHRVVVVWHEYDEAGGTWSQVYQEVETHTPNKTVLLFDLRAGERYQFMVAGVNDVGLGAFSDPFPPEGPILVGTNTATVWAQTPGGEEKGSLPGWAVGGGGQQWVRVELSAQAPGRAVAVEFVAGEGEEGKRLRCGQLRDASHKGATCVVNLAELVGPGGGLATRRELRVEVFDVAGRVAVGTVQVLPPEQRACKVFEQLDRELLCEASIVGVEVEERVDPLNQHVVISLGVGGYERSTDFARWRVVARTAKGAETRRDFLHPGAAGKLKFPGLVAGEVYVLMLAAVSTSGVETVFTSAFPRNGYRVAHSMPIVTPRDQEEIPNKQHFPNQVPRWKGFNGTGELAVDVRLSTPGTAVVFAVEFGARNGDGNGSYSRCELYGERTKEGTSCTLMLGEHALHPEDTLAVRALDEDGNVLSHGAVTLVRASEEACWEWEAAQHHFCTIPDREVSTCVKNCEECTFNNITTFQFGTTCTTDPCAGDRIFCPGHGCIERDRMSPSQGCKEFCYRDTFYSDVTDECIVPCQPGYRLTVAPGTSAPYECPTGWMYTDGEVEYSVISCPETNTQRQETDPKTGMPATWRVPAPKCTRCTSEQHCNGHAAFVSSSDNQTACECSCSPQYVGDTCAECAELHFRRDEECVRCDRAAACHGHGSAHFDLDSKTCKCTCDAAYSGTWCDHCARDRYFGGYPACGMCPNCGGHAVSLSNVAKERCECTCSAAYAGIACELCATGHGPYPGCHDKYDVPHGVPCPSTMRRVSSHWPMWHSGGTWGCRAGGWHPGRPVCRHCVKRKRGGFGGTYMKCWMVATPVAPNRGLCD